MLAATGPNVPTDRKLRPGQAQGRAHPGRRARRGHRGRSDLRAPTGTIPLDLETRFWNAYGILRSTIEPATRARRLYRCVFYASLALMLLCQFYFLFGGAVHKQLTMLREQSYVLNGQLQAVQLPLTSPAVGAATLESKEVIEQRIQQNQLDRSAYAGLASMLVWLSSQQLEVSLATLEIVLEFLATYVLPALYGLLGACAFVLRQLSADIGQLRFADDLRVRYTLRLNIGLLAGLAVGWFISPDQDASVVANLSPLALAFVAGYGSDLLFAVLDRIVAAFSTEPAPGARPARGARRAAGAAPPAPARGRAALGRRASAAGAAEPMVLTRNRRRRRPREPIGAGGERGERVALVREQALSWPRSGCSTGWSASRLPALTVIRLTSGARS